MDNIFHANHPIVNAIRDYEFACESTDDDGSLMSRALEKMDELNAWDFDTKVKQILGKLNIHHLSQDVKTLSGGATKRSSTRSNTH